MIKTQKYIAVIASHAWISFYDTLYYYCCKWVEIWYGCCRKRSFSRIGRWFEWTWATGIFFNQKLLFNNIVWGHLFCPGTSCNVFSNVVIKISFLGHKNCSKMTFRTAGWTELNWTEMNKFERYMLFWSYRFYQWLRFQRQLIWQVPSFFFTILQLPPQAHSSIISQLGILSVSLFPIFFLANSVKYIYPIVSG